MYSIIPTAAARSRSVMVAVVLGTGLTVGGSKSATAAVETPVNRSAVPTGPAPEAVQDIAKYCHVCWRNARLPADRWEDCTQQVFARLLETVAPDNWHAALHADGPDRREFLRAIDAIKKRTQRARRFVDLGSDVADGRNRASADLREQREAVTQAANAVLSDRQQRIIALSADGWAVPDIAAELRTSPERVSDEKYKAIKKLRTHLGVDA
ncbi:MAG: sigma-70 family RNA polymerase sigma factor [Gemmataceae bacterium]